MVKDTFGDLAAKIGGMFLPKDNFQKLSISLRMMLAVKSCLRGYHAFRTICSPLVQEQLNCE